MIVIGVLLILDVVVLLVECVSTYLCVCCSHCQGNAFEKGQCSKSCQISFKHCSPLSGPSRTPGAVIVGSFGVCIIPKPISTLLLSLGGTRPLNLTLSVMLGSMATMAECLYVSVKALVFVLNSIALMGME